MQLIQPGDANPRSRKTSPILAAITRAFDSNLESLDSAESAVLEVARRCGFREIALEHIGLAVHEIMINAIVHGNHSDIEKKVQLTVSRTGEELRITISDQGDGFNPHSLPDPLSPQALRRGSGRGVYLAQALMDEFHVQPGCAGGTTVTMSKHVSLLENS